MVEVIAATVAVVPAAAAVATAAVIEGGEETAVGTEVAATIVIAIAETPGTLAIGTAIAGILAIGLRGLGGGTAKGTGTVEAMEGLGITGVEATAETSDGEFHYSLVLWVLECIDMDNNQLPVGVLVGFKVGVFTGLRIFCLGTAGSVRPRYV